VWNPATAKDDFDRALRLAGGFAGDADHARATVNAFVRGVQVLLERHWSTVEQIAGHLLTHETLDPCGGHCHDAASGWGGWARHREASL